MENSQFGDQVTAILHQLFEIKSQILANFDFIDFLFSDFRFIFVSSSEAEALFCSPVYARYVKTESKQIPNFSFGLTHIAQNVILKPGVFPIFFRIFYAFFFTHESQY